MRKFGRYTETANVTAYFPASRSGPALWHIEYEMDSDEEDLEEDELMAALLLYKTAHSRDLDMLPVHFAWEFEGHELCGARVLRNFGRSRAVGEVSAWLPACTHHEEPAVFAISYRDGMSTICLFV